MFFNQQIRNLYRLVRLVTLVNIMVRNDDKYEI